MKFNFVFILFLSLPAYGDWICREASSTKSGRRVLSCGVGEAKSLQDSKDKARESAILEFNRICDLSIECRDYQSQVIPKRTECIQNGKIHRCYRAIEFNITNIKKKNILVNVEEVKLELHKKQSELIRLEAHLSNIKMLKEKKAKIKAIQKEINQVDGKTIELSELVSSKAIENGDFKYTHLFYDNSIRISLGYTGWNLTSPDEMNLNFNMSYEYRLNHYVGLQAGLGFSGDFSSGLIKSDSDIPNTGTANSNQNYFGSQSTVEYTLATNIYTGVWGSYLKGEMGTISNKRKSYDVTYGPLGTKTGSSELSTTGNKGFWGVYVGLDSREDKKGYGGFFEIGVRNMDSKNYGSINIGANYGF